MRKEKQVKKLNELIEQFQANSDVEDAPIPHTAAEFEELLQSTWTRCDDFKVSNITLGTKQIVLAWLHDIVDKQRLQIGILEPLSQQQIFHETEADLPDILAAIPVDTLESMSGVHEAIADGFVIVFQEATVFSVDLSNMPGKAIEASQSEPVIEGPQEAFTESLEINIAMLRKRLRNPRLKIETTRVGEVTRTSVSVMYLEGIASGQLLEEVRNRLGKIDIDSILDANYLREMMSDEPLSPFPTMETTERPDKLIAAMLQGRVAIMPHGATHALLVPTLFVQFLMASEDMYSDFYIATPIRVLRHIMFWVSVLLPALYVSLLSYHQDLIPTPLLISLIGQHEGIPFPTVVEAFLMQFFFEALREAGQRLPRAVGQSVSIVGGLVIGDAAVNAGIVSPGMVIVVAATGVASFTIAGYSLVNTSRVLQFVFLMAGGVIGLYGVVVVGLIAVTHMVSIRSYGVPYMSPYAPLSIPDMKDAVLRVPWWKMKNRPTMYGFGQARNRTPKPGPRAGE